MYRLAASILVLRISGEGYQFLLLHKPRRNDAWQLPQGGVEPGETVEQAALRELQEEANVTDCVVIGKSEKVYSYNFPESFRRFRPDNVCGQKIQYVFALLDPLKRVRVDGKEIDAHVWITLDQLKDFVERKEYLELVNDLYQEAVKTIRREM